MTATDRDAKLSIVGVLAGMVPVTVFAALFFRAEVPWFGALELVFGALLMTAAALLTYTIASGRTDLRIGVVALMSLAPPIQFLTELGGYALPYSAWESPRIGALAVVVCSVGAVGLVLRKSWARWLALAAAFAGIGSSGLNIVPTLAAPSMYTWVYALALSFSVLVAAALAGPRVREQFETQGADGLWSSRDPSIRSIRAAVLAQLVAIPMLLVYAWVQPIVPESQDPALLLALVLGLGTLSCMARKLVGALILALAGPALLGLTAFTLVRAHASPDPALIDIAAYYACFWVPAGLISTIAAGILARPVWRLLAASE